MFTSNKYRSMITGALLGLMIVTSGCGNRAKQPDTINQTTQTTLIQEDHRLTNESFKEKMKDSSSVVLDVRTAQEFAAGHLPNAININVNGSAFMQEIARLDKTKTYLIYCKSGARSEKAYEAMSETGFASLFTLPTGIVAWDGEIEK